MSEPRITSAAGNRHADVHWEQATRDVVTHPSGRIPAPGTGVGVVWRVSKSSGKMDGFTDLLIGAKSCLPIQRLTHKLWDCRHLTECLRFFSYIASKTYKHSLKF